MIGFNHYGTHPEPIKRQFEEFYKLSRPRAIVVIDDDAWAIQLAQLLGFSTMVIARETMGSYPDGTAKDNTITALMTPQEFVERRRHLAEYGVAAYCGNEVTFSSYTLDWMLGVAKAAHEAELAVVLGNWSVGVPEPEHWVRAEELLRFAATSSYVLIGLHEYYAVHWTSGMGAANTRHVDVDTPPVYHMGRFYNALRFCDEKGIPHPRIAITEFGPDHVEGVGGGINEIRGIWAEQGRPDTEAYAVQQTAEVVEAVYHHRAVNGRVCFFTAAAGLGWPRHDVCRLNLELFLRELVKANISVPNPTQPTPLPATGPETRIVANLSSFLHLRSGAGRSFMSLHQLVNGDRVDVWMNTNVEGDGYIWRPARSAGRSGYIAVKGPGIPGNMLAQPGEPAGALVYLELMALAVAQIGSYVEGIQMEIAKIEESRAALFRELDSG